MLLKQRPLIIFLTLLLPLFIVLAVLAGGADPHLLFTDNLAATGPSPDTTAMEQALLERIGAATSSIDVALYDFNRASVRDALIAARGRGVTVRVVTDDDAYHDGDYQPYFQALEAAGIPVVNDGRSSIMHNKYLVIDGEVVWTGSTNITDNGFTLNHNNSLVFTSTVLADIYTTEFNEMFVDGLFGTAKSDNTSHTLTYAGFPLEVYFSPSDGAMEQVIAAVNAATESIHFSIFFLTEDAIRDALINRIGAGVTVSGVWDALAAGNLYSDDEALCAAGAAIKLENLPGKMHNKFMVIDAGGSNPVVITGSMNWSASGGEANDENTLILRDGAVAQAYLAAFQELYDALGPDRLCRGELFVYLPMVVSPGTPPATLNISGHVRLGDENGPGVPGVSIYRAIATYPGELLAVTDEDGYYELPPFDSHGHQETIRLWAELPGYTFEPPEHIWPYYGYGSNEIRDFVATPVQGPPAAVQITSILYNPDGDDVAGEYVRLENRGGSAQEMAGWTLADAANHVYTFPAFTLEAGAAVQVWTRAGSDTAADLYWGSGSTVWNNNGDTAVLSDGDGQAVDSCTYAGGGTAASCDE